MFFSNPLDWYTNTYDLGVPFTIYSKKITYTMQKLFFAAAFTCGV